jgi:putative DNA primase/helicase
MNPTEVNAPHLDQENGGLAGTLRNDSCLSEFNDKVKPERVDVISMNIPDTLKALPQWVGWKFDPKPGKPSEWTKPPYCAMMPGKRASSTDSSTWASFSDAIKAADNSKGLDGIGFVFTMNDPYVGIDLDKCRNPETGTIELWAQKILDMFPGAYTEITPSGKGLHIIIKGKLQGKGIKHGPVEVYDKERYFTFTGHTLPSSGIEIPEHQAALEAFLTEHFQNEQKNSGTNTGTPGRSWLNDAEVIQKACTAENGEKFKKLWAGDFSDYASQSEADSALCALLAFWCGKNTEQMGRLFRQSGLYRSKWEEKHGAKTYGQATIEHTVEICTETYRLSGTTAEEAREMTQAKVWPEPLPLPDDLLPVKAIEPEMIPAPLRGWLMDIADRMQIPPDFSTAATIVALGSIIGRACGIYPKRHDDWIVIPNLWGAVVGRPSLMKSPAVTEALKPLARLEIKARDQYEEAFLTFSVDLEVQKMTRSNLSESIKKALKKGNDAQVEELKKQLTKLLHKEAPTRKRYQTQDATVEKIGELLNENPRGLLLSRDELIGWLRTLDKDGREGDRAFFLEGWNGIKGFTIDRIGRGTIDIEAVCLSIFGTITPGPLSDYVYQAIRGGKGDDGLMQRFQIIVWPDTPAEWKNVDRFPDTKEKVRAWEVFRALAEQEIPGAMIEDGAEIPALRFTPRGQEIFDGWRDELERRLRGDHGLHPAMESHLTKYRSLMPSMALIFHLVDVAAGAASGPVSEVAAAIAADWCDYLESHACRIYGGASMPGMEEAREILKHIRRGDIKDGCKTWEIWRPQWSRLISPGDAQAGLDVLSSYGWVAVEKIPTGGSPQKIVKLNPMMKKI